MITCQATEVDDIRLGDGAPVALMGFADLQFFKVLAERMHLVRERRRALVVLARQAHQGRRRPLNCSALHIVLDGSFTSQFFPTPGPTRSAVDQRRQGRAMTGGFPCAVPVDD